MCYNQISLESELSAFAASVCNDELVFNSPAPMYLTTRQQTTMSSALADFTTVIHTLRELLNVIDREVTETIDSRDPNKVSPTSAPRASAELLDAYKTFTKCSDKLASFAADPSDVGVTLIGGFHETNAIQVASELGVPDVLGDQELPLSEIAKRVGADECRLRSYLT